ncbi:phosphatase PAP2 family protein [Rhizobium sp. SYY.PMSO]|uniref:phosphatase PAP2 family protein n=1 Tax=Rhizobium sp. SYY.PMSO TaxID=3382192 RepID=UPI000DDCD201
MQDFFRARLVLTVGTPLSYCAAWLLAKAGGLQLDLQDTIIAVLFVGFYTIVLSILATRFKLPTFRAVVECLGCGFLLIVPITLSTYIAMRMDLPVADQQLSQWDSWLGVDWPALMMWVDQHSLLAAAFNQAYRTFSYQLLLWPLILIVAGRSNRAYQMVGAYGLLCFIASAISTLWPAVGTYSFYQFDPNKLHNIDSTYGYFFLQQFHAVRDDPTFVWSLAKSAGILTFPSVHAAVATLCAWAAWEIRLLRYPGLALNVTMALSAVPDANHYVIDVIIGCLVGLAAIAMIVSITKPRKEAAGLTVSLPVAGSN